jgi:hypothetical protein
MLKKLKIIRINKFSKLFVILSFIANTLLFAQEQKIELKIQSNPESLDSWWLEKNNFGIEPTNFNFQSSWELKTLKTTYTINILAQEESVYFNESFIKHNFSDKTFLRVGRYYRDFSHYLNDELSSGHMLISHNAAPMPKIGLVTSQKIKKLEKVDFDFGIAHGFFDKNDLYNKAPLLHEKFLYMNIRKNNYQISIGFIHEAMWGGSTVADGDQPNTFKDFLKVLISEDGPDEGGPHANALGNHLGVTELFFQKNNNNQILKLYYQHFFEDTSGLRFRNEIDGLWGVELKNYIPETTILFEYLDTTHQDMNPPYIDDSYYNHGTYSMGWSYKDYTLGNPFINHLAVEPTEVFHMGISGKILSDYQYKIKASRRININDPVKYKLIFGKTMDNRTKKEVPAFNIFIANNDSAENGIGIEIYWEL